jgi:beta-lactam-binding protein with PASTA domain
MPRLRGEWPSDIVPRRRFVGLGENVFSSRDLLALHGWSTLKASAVSDTARPNNVMTTSPGTEIVVSSELPKDLSSHLPVDEPQPLSADKPMPDVDPQNEEEGQLQHDEASKKSFKRKYLDPNHHCLVPVLTMIDIANS